METLNEYNSFEKEIEEYWDDPVPDDCLEKDKKRAVRRKNDVKKAIRKKELDREVFGRFVSWTARPLHCYSKNKIHCSCPICRAKTNKRANGIYGSYSRNGKNWKHSDLQKINSVEDKIKESI